MRRLIDLAPGDLFDDLGRRHRPVEAELARLQTARAPRAPQRRAERRIVSHHAGLDEPLGDGARAAARLDRDELLVRLVPLERLARAPIERAGHAGGGDHGKGNEKQKRALHIYRRGPIGPLRSRLSLSSCDLDSSLPISFGRRDSPAKSPPRPRHRASLFAGASPSPRTPAARLPRGSTAARPASRRESLSCEVSMATIFSTRGVWRFGEPSRRFGSPTTTEPTSSSAASSAIVNRSARRPTASDIPRSIVFSGRASVAVVSLTAMPIRRSPRSMPMMRIGIEGNASIGPWSIGDGLVSMVGHGRWSDKQIAKSGDKILA